MAVFCLLCGKRFQAQSALQQHMEVHAGVRSYICSECNRTFPSHTALKRHLRSHTGRLATGGQVVEKMNVNKVKKGIKTFSIKPVLFLFIAGVVVKDARLPCPSPTPGACSNSLERNPQLSLATRMEGWTSLG